MATASALTSIKTGEVEVGFYAKFGAFPSPLAGNAATAAPFPEPPAPPCQQPERHPLHNTMQDE
jgi:hypothetical protein